VIEGKAQVGEEKLRGRNFGFLEDQSVGRSSRIAPSSPRGLSPGDGNHECTDCRTSREPARIVRYETTGTGRFRAQQRIPIAVASSEAADINAKYLAANGVTPGVTRLQWRISQTRPAATL
jgi:hypothetical protein